MDRESGQSWVTFPPEMIPGFSKMDVPCEGMSSLDRYDTIDFLTGIPNLYHCTIGYLLQESEQIRLKIWTPFEDVVSSNASRNTRS